MTPLFSVSGGLQEGKDNGREEEKPRKSHVRSLRFVRSSIFNC
jgi:hypothetical protein